MLVKVTEVEKGLFEVRTKVRTPDLDATMSGIVEKGLTRNFYYYLFRELNIQEPRNKVLRQG